MSRFEKLGIVPLTRDLLRPSAEDGDGRGYKPVNMIVLSGTFRSRPGYGAAKLRPGEGFSGARDPAAEGGGSRACVSTAM
jgi:hypothetical protein